MPPVEDHAVHPKTVVGSDFKYGCNNDRAKPDGYYVLTRKHFSDGRYELINEFVFNNMSRKCRNVSFAVDPACVGCPQEKDFDYINRMKALENA